LKILLITGSLHQGGAEFQLLSLADLLQRKGYEIEVLAITDHNYYLPYIEAHRIRYSCVSNNGTRITRLLRAVKQINSKKADIVISYIKVVSQVAILARCLSGFKYRLIISERTSQVKFWHDIYYFNLAILADRVVVNSVAKLNYIRDRFPFIRNRTIFIPNIIDLDRFLKIKKKGADNGEIRISYIGRISPEKNLLNLIKAVVLVKNKLSEITFGLFGESNNPEYLGDVLRLINDSGAREYIKYHGPVKDIEKVYSTTEIVCLVSFYEGFSNVLAEALASGIPVIASDIEENRFLIEESKNGYLADPANPENIANSLIKLLQSGTDEITGISLKNRSKAITLFNEDNIYASYSKLLKELS